MPTARPEAEGAGQSQAGRGGEGKADGEGGDAGPDLSQVASRASREHLLESLIEPDAKIAPGFGTVTLLTDAGLVISGVVQNEDDERTSVKTSDGRVVTVRHDEIEERVEARSPMPQYRRALKKQDLRDLIEFLTTQKGGPPHSTP